MSKKLLIITIAVIIVIGGVVGYYFYSETKTTTPEELAQEQGYQTFNPFGNTDTTATDEALPSTENIATDGNSMGTETEVTIGQTTNAKLSKVTEFAIAGATYFEETKIIPDTTQLAPKAKQAPKYEVAPSLRLVERATGHIYQAYINTKAIGKTSNSTIPNIYEALFDSKAETVIYRYISSDEQAVTSYIATLGKEKGDFLPVDITDISISQDKTKYFYLAENSSGTVGTIASFTDTKKNQIFSSPFTEWISQWVGTKIYLTTKASSLVGGYLYSINQANGSLTKVLGNIPGLTTNTSNDGALVLYGSSGNAGNTLSLFNTKTRVSSALTALTLPEKCVWSANNTDIYCAIPSNMTGSNYPDAWYKGFVSFNDSFVKIDAKTLSVTALETGSTANIDATHLFLDSSDSRLFFTNKKDSTLWMLDLK